MPKRCYQLSDGSLDGAIHSIAIVSHRAGNITASAGLATIGETYMDRSIHPVPSEGVGCT